MKIAPLKKEIYEKLKALNTRRLILRFRGGSDEGYLDAELIADHIKYPGSIYSEIEAWAWTVYNYSGAGDGSDYGDDITYDLESGKVSHSEWYTTRAEGSSYDDSLKIE